MYYIYYGPMNKIAEKRKGMVYFKSGGKVFQAWLEQTSGYPQHRWLQRWRLESKSNSVLYQPGQARGMLFLSGSPSFFISALKMSIWCELVTVFAKHLASVSTQQTEAVITSHIPPLASVTSCLCSLNWFLLLKGTVLKKLSCELFLTWRNVCFKAINRFLFLTFFPGFSLLSERPPISPTEHLIASSSQNNACNFYWKTETLRLA